VSDVGSVLTRKIKKLTIDKTYVVNIKKTKKTQFFFNTSAWFITENNLCAITFWEEDIMYKQEQIIGIIFS
jgi:hypothetical protein